jgi:protein involved in polysaccharide export with SLBB domain
LSQILIRLLVGLSFVVAMTSAKAAETLSEGDIIQLVLPGEPAFDEPYRIDPEGKVELPELGPIPLAGLDLAEAESLLVDRLGAIYRDLSRFRLRILERRRLVKVLGYVRQPGLVDLPLGATVQTAISEAGGLVPGAQLDRMQLRRDGSVTNFDYKKYLDTGDPALIPELRSLDTIFVPVSPLIGNVQVEFDAATLTDGGDASETESAINIFGEVRTPGSYSFNPGMSVVDIIMRAGGVTRYAGVEQIRIISEGEPRPFNLKAYLDAGDSSLLPSLTPGTTIFVPTETVGVRQGARIIYVMGEVQSPGAFEIQNSASFLDVLANAGGPTRFADTRQVRILRNDGRIEPFDLGFFTETEGTPTGDLPVLSAGDAIFVPEKLDLNEKSWLKVPPQRAVYVMGKVNRPGRFEWASEMTLMDLLAHAGGPAGGADVGAIEISTPRGSTVERTLFDLNAYLAGDMNARLLPKISAGTTVMVPELPWDPKDNKSQWVLQAPERSIYVFGAVGAPGRYAFDEAMGLLDILSAADGPTGSADLHKVRITHRGEPTVRVSTIDLVTYFETGDDRLLPSIKPGDTIYVPNVNQQWIDKPKEETVRVLGEVGNPGRYAFTDEMTVLDLLAQAGGPTAAAYQEKIVVVNLSCCRDQARSFDLVGFAKSGDATKLPLVQPGDTIYVPNIEQSPRRQAMAAVTDISQILTLILLIGAL